MNKEKFVGNPRMGLSESDIQVVGENLQRLLDSGIVNPVDVVDSARSISSPLHPFFEWDDSKAAEAYRKQQARLYLRCIKVVMPDEQEVRAFHPVVIEVSEDEEVKAWKPLARIIEQKELLQQVMENECNRLIACQKNLRQYQSLMSELGPIIDGPVQEAITRMGALMET